MTPDIAPLLAVGITLGFAASLPPGPGIRLTVRGAVRRGAAGALDGWAGPALVDFVLLWGVAVACLPDLGGLGPGPALEWCIRIVGGGALVGAGWDLMERRAGGGLYRDEAANVHDHGGPAPFGERLLCSLPSPFGLAVRISGGAALVLGPAGASVPGAGATAGGFLLGGLLLHLFVALRIRRVRVDRVLSDRQFSVVASLGGLFMVGLGLVTAAGAVKESGLPETLSRMIAGLFG